MKLFAYYLPQFHQIKENDEWWGEGFTEWTNVKKAKALYNGHDQPKIPLDDNYYCLLDKKTMMWQARLAKKYSIDGMIFYHYYFNGRLLLEKPAELLLQNIDIPMPFFFCWANHSWFRSWEGSKRILIEQTYGKQKEWESHFQYLLPFFKDSRYEKKDNKPLFMLFNSNFDCKDEFLNFLDKRCKEEGFGGICSIERYKANNEPLQELLQDSASPTRYFYLREPEFAGTKYLRFSKHPITKFKVLIKEYFPKICFRKIIKYSGEEMFQQMIAFSNKSKVLIRGLFFEWDNTPRHGKRGYVITPPTKKSFMEYMNSISFGDYVFINAWNEWCEGMMLEPTKNKGYEYLEWIKDWRNMNEKKRQ